MREREMERWKDGEMERWKDGEMERWREKERERERVSQLRNPSEQMDNELLVRANVVFRASSVAN